MFTVELDHQRLQAALRRVEWAVGDLAPLMRGIGAELASQTEENFSEEGRPDWEDLSDVTTARREKTGNWPGQMLQVSSAGLAASITTRATDSSALVGSNKPYAAMMQFGVTSQTSRTCGVTFQVAHTCLWTPRASCSPKQRKRSWNSR